MKATKISTGGVIEDIELEDGNTLADLQKHVGGYIEIISIGATTDLVINEEGKVYGLDRNPTADALLQQLGVELLPGDFIVGNVVVIGTNSEGETDGIPAESRGILEALRVEGADQ